MGMLIFIIAGGITGFIAPKFMAYKGRSRINIVIGIAGGFPGAILVEPGEGKGPCGFN